MKPVVGIDRGCIARVVVDGIEEGLVAPDGDSRAC